MSTTIRNENLFCQNCGSEFKLVYPMKPEDFSKKTKAFDTLHKDCPPTWKEPEADQTKDTYAKAMWWWGNGETGLSSKTMWGCLMNIPPIRIHHPHDPDDFKRCYKLLQAVPEWKNELHKLKPLSPVWEKLVDNWDKLTEYYEDMMVVKKANGMYEFMESLGC